MRACARTPRATSLPDPIPAGVLVTRPRPGAARTAARLRELGFSPVLAPALTIQALPARLPDPAQVQAVLITSANALPAMPADYRARPLFAVGGATAMHARQAGFTDIHNADGDAATLAALVAQICDPTADKLVLLSGRGQGGALAVALRARGFRVLRRVVYAAIPIPELPMDARAALAGGRIGHALFFSAETARAFLRQVHRAKLTDCLRKIDAISIGQPARVALEAVAWRRIRVAARPTQDAMLACLR